MTSHQVWKLLVACSVIEAQANVTVSTLSQYVTNCDSHCHNVNSSSSILPHAAANKQTHTLVNDWSRFKVLLKVSIAISNPSAINQRWKGLPWRVWKKESLLYVPKNIIKSIALSAHERRYCQIWFTLWIEKTWLWKRRLLPDNNIGKGWLWQ